MKFFLYLTLTWALLPPFAFAGTGTGKIIELMIHDSSDGGVLMFRTENNLDKAECSTASNGEAWAVTLESAFGKAVLSQILAAQSQNKGINVKGTGDCNDWFDRERPSYIYTS